MPVLVWMLLLLPDARCDQPFLKKIECYFVKKNNNLIQFEMTCILR